MTYQEQLFDPRWQRRRTEIWHRDNFRCLECGSPDKTLTVHHVIYTRHLKLWDYESDLLQTFCVDCHGKRQDLIDGLSNALKIALKDVPIPRIDPIAQRLCAEAMEATV